MSTEKKPELPLEDRVKQDFWRVMYPVFPFLQKALLKLHIISHTSGRQRFHIGWLKAGATLDELKEYLSTKWNFGNHFIAWKDTDQVLSWRRLASFEEQWHLRVYVDGEIRGHYEKTPEAKPLAHLAEIGETERTQDFKKFLGEYCALKQSPMHLERDQTMTDPVSEITLSSTPTFSDVK